MLKKFLLIVLWAFGGLVALILLLGILVSLTSSGADRTTGSAASCFSMGVQYYSEIGSYPYLSDGRLADDVIRSKCAGTNNRVFD